MSAETAQVLSAQEQAIESGKIIVDDAAVRAQGAGAGWSLGASGGQASGLIGNPFGAVFRQDLLGR